MSIKHSKVTNIGRLFLILIAVIFFSLPMVSRGENVSSQFDRADVKTIKMHTNQILSDPKFHVRKTFWQWLREKFSSWNGPEINLGPGWKTFILTIIIAWCVLTLIAILIHFIWSISLFIRQDKNSRFMSSRSGSGTVKVKSFEELYKQSHDFAERGLFNEAISLMIAGLLRWLDFKGFIRFHESKTNGDYVREYPGDGAGQKEFQLFVSMFEQSIYGGLNVDSRTYQKMNLLMEHIRASVSS